jgi:hypothetical protein
LQDYHLEEQTVSQIVEKQLPSQDELESPKPVSEKEESD